MADEEVLPIPTHAPLDLKRKHEDLEPDCPEILSSDTITVSISHSESLNNPDEEDGNVTNGGAPDVLEPKRPRLEEKPDVDKNGYQDEKPSFFENKDEKLSANTDGEVDKKMEEDNDSKKIVNDISVKVEEETPSLTTDNQTDEKQSLVYSPQYSPQVETAKLEPSAEELEANKTSSHAEVLKEEYMDEQSMMSTQTVSRKIEVPNNKVGVLIGKSGDTIRSLQNNSNAKIQITRDSEADPNSSMRPVEIIGTLENISKAEKLIKDVIAEADAGGSPALVARGFNNAQSNETGEQVEIKVPNEKVGLIIGKGGETIKNLQMRSGARIQLIQQHGPDGDEPKERTVRLTGSKRQIETAREMIDEVMAQPVRTSSQSSGGYGSQGHRSRGPSSGPTQWGSRGGGMRPPQHPTGGYDYNRGPYPSQNQYPSQYGGGGYPHQQHVPSRNNNYGGPGWDNRPPPQSMQGPHGGGGYDYYGGGGGGQADHHPPTSTHGQGGPPPMGPSHQNYNNYGQDYGQQQQPGQAGPYSHVPPPAAQGYGGQSHGPPPTYGGGGYGGQQPPPGGPYPQTGGGYPQDQYGKAAPPTSYGGQPQGQSGQSYYGQGRGPPVSEYNQNVYPYGHTQQQGYPPPPNYGSAPPPAVDGYNQQPHVVQQQQPVSGGYAQAGGQQQPVSGGYAQPVSGGYGQMGYGSYQSGYPEQQQQQQPPVAAGGGAYGYQSSTGGDQAAYAGGGYAQPAAAGQQGGYDQSVQQPQQPPQAGGGYGNGAPAGAAPAVGY